MNKKAFDKFMADEGSSYPYNEIRVTRRGFHCKWILLASHGSLFPLRASTLSVDTVTHIIVSKQGMPLTPPMCDVADVAEWWPGCNPNWKRDVHRTFAYFLQKRERVSKRQLFMTCFLHEVEDLLRLRIFNMRLSDDIRNQWSVFYHHLVDKGYENVTMLLSRSVGFVNDMMLQSEHFHQEQEEIPLTYNRRHAVTVAETSM